MVSTGTLPQDIGTTFEKSFRSYLANPPPKNHFWHIRRAVMSRLCQTDTLRDDIKTKKTFQFGHCPILGGGFTLARIFLRPFLLKEKVSSMVAAAERVGKVAQIS